MQKAYLEVVRFSESDVIATSTFDTGTNELEGVYFTTFSEYNQFAPGTGEHNYISFEADPPSSDPYNIYYKGESDSPYEHRYAWYDTGDGTWHSADKYAADYWNGSSYTFPTGGN